MFASGNTLTFCSGGLLAPVGASISSSGIGIMGIGAGMGIGGSYILAKSSKLSKLESFTERNIGNGKCQLNSSEKQSIQSLQKRIAEHNLKLTNYKNNPYAYDNKNYLKNAPSDTIKKEIIKGRINHLEKEIKTFQKTIDNILNKGK